MPSTPQKLTALPKNAVIVGWDFSTGGVKCLAFDVRGKVIARATLTTDLWYGAPDKDHKLPEHGVRELNLAQLEGQVHASLRLIAAKLKKKGRLKDWIAGGISATHHSAGRIDEFGVQVRRAICWNDQTLAKYHEEGMRNLGGPSRVAARIHGPWAIRYSLSHLVKDAACLEEKDWRRTHRILPHGPLAAGYLTGNFDVTSVSSAASTGIMDFQNRTWNYSMLEAIKDPVYRTLARKQLPKIVDHFEPVGRLSPALCVEAGIDPKNAPWIFPTSDDQAAGLVGGGAVSDGQLAIILGTSAVVNSSSLRTPTAGNLDVMCLNWEPYLWMRCYNNGAGVIHEVFKDVDPIPYDELNTAAENTPAGCKGVRLSPFLAPEPSLGVPEQRFGFSTPPKNDGVKFRACLEAIACLIAMGVDAHRKAGQEISQITVSGGIARSSEMCRILATVLNANLRKLKSDEGPALGAAVTALAAAETHLRRSKGNDKEYAVSDAVASMVKFGETVKPTADEVAFYQDQLREFQATLPKA